jgi:PKHD-type hydroxylase
MRQNWQMWEGGFTPKEIDYIISVGEAATISNATVFSDKKVNTDIRSSKVRWIFDRTVREMLQEKIILANNAAFSVDLNGHCEMQYTEYHASEKGHYDWHHDIHWDSPANSDRKLSITVQLTESSEYEGGEFEFQECQSPSEAARSQGTVLVFPSYLKHRVLPVTSGTRKSLVAWFHGPRWR